ncbi:MAG: hypothetical protein HY685_07160 [Chloroflexi bacterium]|nr:hypothetical protein [Chloroflexota bacterium]
MAAVPWNAISRYIETAHKATGQVEREDILTLADHEGMMDDNVVDALDAIGSRIFRGADAVSKVREFLVGSGYVLPE